MEYMLNSSPLIYNEIKLHKILCSRNFDKNGIFRCMECVRKNELCKRPVYTLLWWNQKASNEVIIVLEETSERV
jgi:hypothetical protein